MIPVDEKKNQFIDHIKANPRTILSSRFGDGKSYFIRELMKDEKILEEFTFLTIYPVNYQVAENADIFELIKRDLLFQMMAKGMVTDDVTLSEAEMFGWFVRSDGMSFLGDLMENLPLLGIPGSVGNTIVGVMKTAKLFCDFSEKYKEFKKKTFFWKKDAIEKFMDRFDKSGIYECDTVTSIIRKALEQHKLSTRKRVVLFIEDMDRIDPAHLFRILNILSAHIDYRYRGEQEEQSENKFGLDNIVLVIDYDVLEKVFKNFYGEEANFQGYISKYI